MVCLFFGASKPVSRVLSFKTAIYLDALLPIRSSRLPGTAGPAICPSTALLRIEFTAMDCSQPSGELLPRLSTFSGRRPVVYFCCTFPRVAPGGCYPLSLPCGARTFLTDGPFAPPARLSSLLALLSYMKLGGLSNYFALSFSYSWSSSALIWSTRFMTSSMASISSRGLWVCASDCALCWISFRNKNLKTVRTKG